MSVEAHPVGYRPPLGPPSWASVLTGVGAGILLAILPLAALKGLLFAMGHPAGGWSLGSAVFAVTGTLVWIVCVRVTVHRFTWRTVSFWELFAICALGPVVGGIDGSLAVNLVPLGAVILLVRYRSTPNSHFRPSVGYRLASRDELDKIVSH